MKPPLMRMYVAALPGVEAEQRRKLLDDYTAASSVQFKLPDVRSHMRDLEKAARRGKREKARKPTAADLAGMGVTVVRADD